MTRKIFYIASFKKDDKMEALNVV